MTVNWNCVSTLNWISQQSTDGSGNETMHRWNIWNDVWSTNAYSYYNIRSRSTFYTHRRRHIRRKQKNMPRSEEWNIYIFALAEVRKKNKKKYRKRPMKMPNGGKSILWYLRKSQWELTAKALEIWSMWSIRNDNLINFDIFP